jgi:hypothetical protein
LAAIFARSKFGIAMAAMIKMIATTISNSISEKPFCLFFINSPPTIFLEFISSRANVKASPMPLSPGEAVPSMKSAYPSHP